jgi:hypothetical protein
MLALVEDRRQEGIISMVTVSVVWRVVQETVAGPDVIEKVGH